jgi:hypothetical protein
MPAVADICGRTHMATPNYDWHFIPPHIEILSVAIAALEELQKSVAADRTRQARLRANSCSRQPVAVVSRERFSLLAAMLVTVRVILIMARFPSPAR